MTTIDQPLTKQDLLEALKAFGTELKTEIRAEMHCMEDRLTSNFRTELDESEARITRTLMDHTEEVVAANNTELLDLIAEVFQPTQHKVTDHEIRIRRLERAAARRRWTVDKA